MKRTQHEAIIEVLALINENTSPVLQQIREILQPFELPGEVKRVKEAKRNGNEKNS